MCQCRYVILLGVWLFCASSGDIIRNVDICGPHNGRRLYVELGEEGVLRADNVSLVKNSPRQDSSRPYATSNSSHDQCSLELITCPSCIINLTFKSINLHHHCGDGGTTIDSPCRCDYVWISEPPYEDVSGTPFCGHYAPISYRSNTRTLSIALLYSQSHKHAFMIEYTAERNRLALKGSSVTNEMSKSMNNTGGGVLTSPFFPSRYPRDLGMEYIITCPSETPDCRVRVLFSDFQLATVSIMEFYDWNGQRLDVSSGARFRPPIIVSSGPSLLIRFYANGGTGLGYKAFYSFVPVEMYDKHSHPITDCGGYVDDLGGAITMLDMVGEGVKTYDCVWLIRPPKNFLHMKTHMYLKVITFAEMAGNTELIIKQGPTSALMPLETLRHPVSQLQPPRLREHIAPITSGFHVSLRGSFGPNSRLAIAYAAFSYMDCFTGSDFLCQNHRCITGQLNCDGFDHCGDNSDEPATCLHDWDVGMPERKWQQSKANYYFPKIDRYPDLKTATLVFVASSLGLIILIAALIILLYRVGARARQQRELQSRLRTISELLDGARIDEISVATDDPPVYEAPPNYDEVIKLGMEEETGSTRRKKRRGRRDSRRSRSHPSSQCSCEYEPQLTLNIHEEATRSSETSPSSQGSGEQVMPESPPPPYVTPPGTVPRSFNYSFANDLPGPSGASSSGPLARSCNESSDSSGSPTRTRACRGTCRDAEARRSWLRHSGSFSRSLPSSRAASSSPPGDRSRLGGSELAEDGGGLGAYLPGDEQCCGHHHHYLQHYHNHHHQHNNHNHHHHHKQQPAVATTDCDSRLPQPRSSSAASASTRAECAGSCSSAPEQQQRPRRAPGPAEARAGDAAAPGEEEEVLAGEGAGPERPTDSCSCEGACGCASSGLEPSSGEGLALVPQRSASEDSPSARSRIIRLLAGSRLGPQSLDGSGVSTSCSTPCGTFSRACRAPRLVGARKLSICSRDPCLTRGSTISDYEKLRDEFEVVSETSSTLGPGSLGNTPRTTPSKYASLPIMSAAGERDGSVGRELDNLYESIKVLDSFLAQRANAPSSDATATATTTTPRSSWPMAVMLFGTPRHRVYNNPGNNYGSNTPTSSRRESDDSSEPLRVRVSRSSDNAFTK